MIKKIVSHMLHDFDEPIDDREAFQCASECEGQDEHHHFVFEREVGGVWTCDEVEAAVEKFHRMVILNPIDKQKLRQVMADLISTRPEY